MKEIMPKKHDHRPEINARLGIERTRRRKKPLDRLTRDAIAAEQAGMSYGQYKAQHPHTPEDGDEIEAPEPEPLPTDPGIYERTCIVCGKVFYMRTRARHAYCGDYCRQFAKSQREAEKRNKEKQEEKEND